jgi:ribosomal protein S18 acetylase RimI-like enzyme
MNLRRAIAADAATIAGIHVRGWQWGYRDLLPSAFLEGLSIPQREASWRGRGRARARLRHLPGPSTDAASLEGAGEVYAIYQEEHAAGTGVGRALFSHAMSQLAKRGFKVAVLWVLENNARARRFYEIAGFRPDGTSKEDRRADHVRHELRYRKDLA